MLQKPSSNNDVPRTSKVDDGAGGSGGGEGAISNSRTDSRYGDEPYGRAVGGSKMLRTRDMAIWSFNGTPRRRKISHRQILSKCRRQMVHTSGICIDYILCE